MLYPTRVGRRTLLGPAPCPVTLISNGQRYIEMAAPTWARARARATIGLGFSGPHPACVRAHVQVGGALSTESVPFEWHAF